MSNWDGWSDIEAAQAKADAEDVQRMADRTAGRKATPEPIAAPEALLRDPEANAAILEAERVIWPHPIPPTTWDRPQPTNADGSRRDGYWNGNVWTDRPKPDPVPPVEAMRFYLRFVADALRRKLGE